MDLLLVDLIQQHQVVQAARREVKLHLGSSAVACEDPLWVPAGSLLRVGECCDTTRKRIAAKCSLCKGGAQILWQQALDYAVYQALGANIRPARARLRRFRCSSP